MKFKVGSVIQERYEILQELGEGGFASVFRVYDRKLDRLAAVKVLRTFANQDEAALERFQREARIIAGLSHPNICSVYTFDVIDGNPCIFMEYLKGQSLSKAIAENSINSFEQLRNIFVAVCAALSYAHKGGIIHRDLTPNNIFLVESKQETLVKVIDFGFAKLGSADETRLTKTGLVVGSPHYMSPEQSRGEPLDPRSDIYSLCCVLYEAFSGRKMFSETNPVTVLHLQQKEYPREPQALFENAERAEQVKAIILRGLQKDTAKRFQSCDEISAAFLDDGSNYSTKTLLLRGKDLQLWEGVVGAGRTAKGRWVGSGPLLLVFLLAVISLSYALILKQRSAGDADIGLTNAEQNHKDANSTSKMHHLAVASSFDFMINQARKLFASTLYERALADLDTFAKAKSNQNLSSTELVQLTLLKADCYFKLLRGDEALSVVIKTLSQLENDPACSDDDRCALLQKQLQIYGFFPLEKGDEQAYRVMTKIVAILKLSDTLSSDRKAELWLTVSDYQMGVVYLGGAPDYRALVSKTAPMESIENAIKAKGTDSVDPDFVNRCWKRKATLYYFMGLPKQAEQAVVMAFKASNDSATSAEKAKCQLALDQANCASAARWYSVAIDQINVALQCNELNAFDRFMYLQNRANWLCLKWRHPGRKPFLAWRRNNPAWLHDLEMARKDIETAESIPQENLQDLRSMYCLKYAVLTALEKPKEAELALANALKPLPGDKEPNLKASVASMLSLAGSTVRSPQVEQRAIDLYQGIPGFDYERKWAQDNLKTAVASDNEDKKP